MAVQQEMLAIEQKVVAIEQKIEDMQRQVAAAKGSELELPLQGQLASLQAQLASLQAQLAALLQERVLRLKQEFRQEGNRTGLDMHLFYGCRMFWFALVPLAYLVTQVMTFWLEDGVTRDRLRGVSGCMKALVDAADIPLTLMLWQAAQRIDENFMRRAAGVAAQP